MRPEDIDANAPVDSSIVHRIRRSAEEFVNRRRHLHHHLVSALFHAEYCAKRLSESKLENLQSTRVKTQRSTTATQPEPAEPLVLNRTPANAFRDTQTSRQIRANLEEFAYLLNQFV